MSAATGKKKKNGGRKGGGERVERVKGVGKEREERKEKRKRKKGEGYRATIDSSCLDTVTLVSRRISVVHVYIYIYISICIFVIYTTRHQRSFIPELRW